MRCCTSNSGDLPDSFEGGENGEDEKRASRCV